MRHLHVAERGPAHLGVPTEVEDVLVAVGLVLQAFVLDDQPPLLENQVADDAPPTQTHVDVDPRTGETREGQQRADLGLPDRARSRIEVVEDPHGLVRPVPPQLRERQVSDLGETHVLVMQQPVAHLDRIEDASACAVGHERARRSHPDAVGGWQRAGPVEKDPVQREVQVARDHEPERPAWPEVEAQLLDPGDPGRVRVGGQRQRRRAHVVVGRHLVVSVAPDPRMDPDEPSTLEHPRRHAEAGRVVPGERTAEKLRWDRTHPAMAPDPTRPSGARAARLWTRTSIRAGVHVAGLAGSGELATVRLARTVARSPRQGSLGWMGGE